ncbi:MAG: TIR domain-containing protein [bacterium]
MSINSITSKIDRLEREIANLEKQKSGETDKEVRISKNIDSLATQASKSKSPSTIKSKLNQIRSKESELAKIEKKKANFSKKIADKNKQIRKYKIDLGKEQEKERKRIKREQLEFQEKLSRELENHKKLASESLTLRENDSVDASKKHDAFISHASEDKEDFVRPLAEALQNDGVKVWYDEFELKWGDSLRRSIDLGLANSTYGIVILSDSFFKKNWTQYELDGLVDREMNGIKVILPIWHKVTKDEVQKFSPSLANKKALNSSIYSINEIAEELKKLLVQPDL